MNNKPSVSTLKKYLNAMSKTKFKYVTAERLSKMVGIYPEVITDTLSYFDPMLVMDYEYNLLELIPQIKDYIIVQEEKKTPINRSTSVTKKELHDYESVNDFVYRKMSIGGMIDKSVELTDHDLRILKKLINEEQAKRKNKK